MPYGDSSATSAALDVRFANHICLFMMQAAKAGGEKWKQMSDEVIF